MSKEEKVWGCSAFDAGEPSKIGVRSLVMGPLPVPWVWIWWRARDQ